MLRSTSPLSDNAVWMERVFKFPADPRVQGWPMMGSPMWPVAVATAYLYFVLSYGPKFMKNRPAYSFKTFIYCYNVYQVVANSLMFYTVLTSGWLTSHSLGCQAVDRSDNPEAMRMASAMWWWFMLKQSELIETALFVLRKKKLQVSFLHIYHHVSTYIVAWLACYFVPGGMSSFTVMPNSLVHVMMYTYYLLAAIDNPALRRVLASYKKYMTTIQIVQLVIIVAHAFQSLLPSCQCVPKSIAFAFVPNVLLVIQLFFNFYQSNYKKAASKEAGVFAPAANATLTSTTSPATSHTNGRMKHE